MAGSYGRIIYNIYRLYFDFAQDFNVFIVRNIRRKEIKIGFSQSLTFMFIHLCSLDFDPSTPLNAAQGAKFSRRIGVGENVWYLVSKIVNLTSKIVNNYFFLYIFSF